MLKKIVFLVLLLFAVSCERPLSPLPPPFPGNYVAGLALVKAKPEANVQALGQVVDSIPELDVYAIRVVPLSPIWVVHLEHQSFVKLVYHVLNTVREQSPIKNWKESYESQVDNRHSFAIDGM